MGDNLYRTFALLIAQVLPGLILVLGLSQHVPLFSAWLGAAAAQEITVGSTVMVLLSAVACGLILSGARYLVFEAWYGVKKGDDSGPALEAAAKNDSKLTDSVERIHVQHYAYYQFYGSTFIALPAAVLLTIGWPDNRLEWAAATGTVVAMLILWFSAVNAMKRFLEKRAALLTKG